MIARACFLALAIAQAALPDTGHASPQACLHPQAPQLRLVRDAEGGRHAEFLVHAGERASVRDNAFRIRLHPDGSRDARLVASVETTRAARVTVARLLVGSDGFVLEPVIERVGDPREGYRWRVTVAALPAPALDALATASTARLVLSDGDREVARRTFRVENYRRIEDALRLDADGACRTTP